MNWQGIKDSFVAHKDGLYAIGNGRRHIVHALAGDRVEADLAKGDELVGSFQTKSRLFYYSNQGRLVDALTGEMVYESSLPHITHVYEHLGAIEIISRAENLGRPGSCEMEVAKVFPGMPPKAAPFQFFGDSTVLFSGSELYLQLDGVGKEWGVAHDVAFNLRLPDASGKMRPIANSSCVSFERESGFHVYDLEERCQIATFDFLPEWAATFPGEETTFFGYAKAEVEIAVRKIVSFEDPRASRSASKGGKYHHDGPGFATIPYLFAQTVRSDPRIIPVGMPITGLTDTKRIRDGREEAYHVLFYDRSYKVSSGDPNEAISTVKNSRDCFLLCVASAQRGNDHLAVALDRDGSLLYSNNKVFRDSGKRLDFPDGFVPDFFTAVGPDIYCAANRPTTELYKISVGEKTARPPLRLVPIHELQTTG